MATRENSPGEIARTRLTALLDRWTELESRGAAKARHPDHDQFDLLLDEMQDAVGLGGKMVMERDIVDRARKILAE